jgi:tetratricopeptide (TPR) repeat protein
LFRTDATGALDEMQAVAESALATFSDLGDERGLAHASRLLSLTHGWVAHYGAMGDCLESALDHLKRIDDPHERPVTLTWLAISLYYGPTPVPEALPRTEEIAELVKADRVSYANTRALLAGLFAMQGRFEEADELIAWSVAMLEELDVPVRLGHARRIAAEVHLHADRPQAAEQELRVAHATLDRLGDRAGAVAVALELAEVLCAQGRHAEAEEWLAPTREVLERSDVMTRVTGLGVEAKLLAQAGLLGDADAVARRAVELADVTDVLTTRARAWLALAEVLSLEGKADQARAAVTEAVERFEAKGDLAGARHARRLFSGVPARA